MKIGNRTLAVVVALAVLACGAPPEPAAPQAAQAAPIDCAVGAWLTADGAYPGIAWPADRDFPGADLRPANATPPTQDNVEPCDFYNWSWQIFMNLTTVLDQQGNLTPPGSIAHNTGTPDANDGVRFLNYERGQNLQNPAYVAEIIDRLKAGESTKPWDMDSDGRHGHEVPRVSKTDEELVSQAGTPEDVDKSHGVLVDQNKNLVYYGTRANGPMVKVIAYVQDEYGHDVTQLPASYDFTMSDEAFAHFNIDNPDHFWPTEIKTAWQIAGEGVDTGDYVAIEAEVAVPVQDPTTEQYYIDQSLPNPTLEKKTLLLLGLHVAGTVDDHPEMIWTSFEHVGLAPDKNEVPATGDYALYASGAVRCNQATLVTMKKLDEATPDKVWLSLPAAGGTSVPLTDLADLQGADICREYPNGLPANVDAPGVFPADSAQQKAWVTSLNAAVVKFLENKGDLRRSYRMMGSTWTTTTATQAGQPDKTVTNLPVLPTGFASFDTYPTSYYNQVGTPFLASMTMESFTQAQSCFTCHNGNDPGDSYPSSLQVSHIFSGLRSALISLENSP